MAETTAQQTSSRNTKIGRVVSTKMSKTIVVQVIMKRAHPLVSPRGGQVEKVLCAR